MTEAVGSHPLLDHIALARISDVGRKLRLPLEELDVVVVGHGTTKSRESFRATNRVAAKILAARLANQATALFLDEKPGLDEWRDLTTKRNVVVLPFLMSLGKHCGEDIPKLLGLNERNPVLRETLIRGAAPFGPETVADRRLWLCPPIGADHNDRNHFGSRRIARLSSKDETIAQPLRPPAAWRVLNVSSKGARQDQVELAHVGGQEGRGQNAVEVALFGFLEHIVELGQIPVHIVAELRVFPMLLANGRQFRFFSKSKHLGDENAFFAPVVPSPIILGDLDFHDTRQIDGQGLKRFGNEGGATQKSSFPACSAVFFSCLNNAAASSAASLISAVFRVRASLIAAACSPTLPLDIINSRDRAFKVASRFQVAPWLDPIYDWFRSPDAEACR